MDGSPTEHEPQPNWNQISNFPETAGAAIIFSQEYRADQTSGASLNAVSDVSRPGNYIAANFRQHPPSTVCLSHRSLCTVPVNLTLCGRDDG